MGGEQGWCSGDMRRSRDGALMIWEGSRDGTEVIWEGSKDGALMIWEV